MLNPWLGRPSAVARFLMILALLGLPLSSAPAQSTGALGGVLTTALSGAPVADARLLLLDLGRSTISDDKGAFRFSGVPVGNYRLVAQAIGHAPDTIQVAIRAGIESRVAVILRRAATILDPVVVTATREATRRAEGSLTVDGLTGSEIREVRAAHPSGILNRLAGVHVSETSGEGHMMAMRLQITTAPMYLYLEDGIPTRPTGFFNHNALYEVNLPQAGGIEVIKGPGTALYGSDAIGGIVNVLTRPAPLSPSLELNLENGSYGHRRLLASAGSTFGNHGIRFDANVTHSDNWKAEATFDRQSGTLRWDAWLGRSGWNARTVIAGSRIDQTDVPALPRALYDSASAVNLAPIAYRRARALRVSTAFERESGSDLLAFTPYARLNRMDLLPSWQLTYDPQTWVTTNSSIGFLARWRRDVGWWDGRVILGVDGDLSPGSYLATQAIVTRTGPYNQWTTWQDGATHYDYDVSYRAISPYLQTNWTPAPKLRVDLGVRLDISGYRYATHLTPVATGTHRVPDDTTVSYRHASPKVGATWEFSPSLAVYGSWRHGFRAPSFGQLFTQNSAANTVGLQPVTTDSWEGGLRGQLGERAVYQLAAYTMQVTNDILTYVTPENTREARNAGAATHRGIEASVGLALTSALRLDAAYSIADHVYDEWIPQAASDSRPAIDYSGKLIEQAPRTLGSAILAWSPTLLRGGRLAVEWSHLGRYAQNAANDAFYEGHHLVGVHANAMVGPRAELFLKITNLANTQYAELSSYDTFQKDTYTVGNPRMVYGGIRYAW